MKIKNPMPYANDVVFTILIIGIIFIVAGILGAYYDVNNLIVILVAIGIFFIFFAYKLGNMPESDTK